MVAFEAIDALLLVFSVLMFIVMFGLLLVVPALVFGSALGWKRRLASDASGGRMNHRRGMVGMDRMTPAGWVAVGLAAGWAAWSISKLVSMTILDITALTDPMPGFDPVPNADLTLFQRDGAWAVVWLGLPVVALLVVIAMRRRGVALVVGTALVPITLVTGVVAYEALPTAVLLTVAGFLGQRPVIRERAPVVPDVPPPSRISPDGPTLDLDA